MWKERKNETRDDVMFVAIVPQQYYCELSTLSRQFHVEYRTLNCINPSIHPSIHHSSICLFVFTSFEVHTHTHSMQYNAHASQDDQFSDDINWMVCAIYSELCGEDLVTSIPECFCCTCARPIPSFNFLWKSHCAFSLSVCIAWVKRNSVDAPAICVCINWLNIEIESQTVPFINEE